MIDNSVSYSHKEEFSSKSEVWRDVRSRAICLVESQGDVVYYGVDEVAKGYRSLVGVAQIMKITFLHGDLGKEISITQPGDSQLQV